MVYAATTIPSPSILARGKLLWVIFAALTNMGCLHFSSWFKRFAIAFILYVSIGLTSMRREVVMRSSDMTALAN
jgi:hypothetical protein